LFCKNNIVYGIIVWYFFCEITRKCNHNMLFCWINVSVCRCRVMEAWRLEKLLVILPLKALRPCGSDRLLKNHREAGREHWRLHLWVQLAPYSRAKFWSFECDHCGELVQVLRQGLLVFSNISMSGNPYNTETLLGLLFSMVQRECWPTTIFFLPIILGFGRWIW